MPQNTQSLPSSFRSTLVPAPYAVTLDGTSAPNRHDELVPIASCPCWVTALCRDPDGNNWSLRLHWLTLDGEERARLLPLTGLMSRDLDLVRDLVREGLLVRNPHAFRDYLTACASERQLPRIRSIRRLGFFSLPALPTAPQLGFMLPDGALLPTAASATSDEELRFEPSFDSPGLSAYTSSGTLDEWRAMVEPLRHDSLLVFAICAGLAGPFLDMAGLENGGINLHGQSSSGKTTALQLAASVWGCGADPQRAGGNPTLIERWNSTANAMEPVVAAHSNMLLAIDELGSGFDPNIYNVFGGRGKSRMTETGTQRTSHAWTIFVLSTGELSMQAKIETDGRRKARTGELIRMIDVPVDQLPRDSSLSTNALRQQMDAVKQQCSLTFGTAGPALIQAVLDEFADANDLRAELAGLVKEAHTQLCAEAVDAGNKLLAPHMRAMVRLALVQVVGTWACGDVLPFDEADVTVAVRAVRDAWLGEVSGLVDGERVADLIRSYVVKYPGQLLDDDGLEAGAVTRVPQTNRGILRGQKLLLTADQLRDACGELPSNASLQDLVSDGILIYHNERQYTTKHTVFSLGGVSRFYAFRLDKLFPAGMDSTDGEPAHAGDPVPQPGEPDQRADSE